MFRSFDNLPDEVSSQPCEKLLNSPKALRPNLLNQNEGTVMLFNPTSLEAHFAQFPDGRRTSAEIEQSRLNGNR